MLTASREELATGLPVDRSTVRRRRKPIKQHIRAIEGIPNRCHSAHHGRRRAKAGLFVDKSSMWIQVESTCATASVNAGFDRSVPQPRRSIMSHATTASG